MLSESLFSALMKLVAASGLGAMIGFEREMSGKDPSLRTFALISLGSCMFSIVSIEASYMAGGADPGRIASQVVTGIGFLGAGAIFRSTKGISGLTTAALMWVTAGIGMCVGYNLLPVAALGTFLALVISLSLRVVRIFVPRTAKQKKEDREAIE
jgi:putative Mg2+ transporter-C (MgtC) family protein